MARRRADGVEGDRDVVGFPGGFTVPVNAAFRATEADPAVFLSAVAIGRSKPLSLEVGRGDGLKVFKGYWFYGHIFSVLAPPLPRT